MAAPSSERSDRQLDGLRDFGVQMQVDVELAGVADHAGRQAHFALAHVGAGRGDRLGDVAGADRAEQLALVAAVGLDRDREAGQLLGARRGGGLAIRCRLPELRAAKRAMLSAVAETALP